MLIKIIKALCIIVYVHIMNMTEEMRISGCYGKAWMEWGER
jgi:hypothetical protein